MFRGKLWKKLLITYLLIVMTIFLTINYPLKIWLTKKQEERSVRSLKNNASYGVDLYEKGDHGSKNFQERIRQAEIFLECRYLLVNSQGEILFDSLNEKTYKNVFNYYSKMTGTTVLNKTTLGGLLSEAHMLVVSEVRGDDMIPNYILTLKSYAVVNDAVEDSVYRMNMMGLAISVLLLFVVIGYGVYYTRLLRYMIRLTAAYADGKFEGRRKRKKFSDENQELANAIDYLAEKTEGLVEYQKTFVANISHDFRSPLTSIRGYTVAMKDGTIPYERQAKYLDIILFETDRLAGLTQNLLDLNEFDSGAVKLNLTDFNLCAMVKQSAATFEAICASKKLKLRLIFSEKEIWVKADKQKIQQVLHNLVDNAIKFSNEDSRVEVTVTAREGKAYVSVRDYGIGIPKDALNQVWERFYKTDLSRGKDKKGTGLGLSITKQIINAHDEKIIVDSTVGEGTEFTFSLTESEKSS